MNSGALTGRVAVVTGAGRGIGRALALALAAQGAVVVGSSRTASDLEDLVRTVEQHGGCARAVLADASDPDQAREPVLVAARDFGAVDILVNNVGGRAGPFPAGFDDDPYELSDEVFGYLLTLNLMSGWWTTSAALPVMRERGYGRVINIGSGLSKRAGRSMPYTAAKHGIVGMTVALAARCGVDGITVNCLCPGWTRTSHNDWAVVGKRMGGVSAERAHAQAASENAQRRVLEADELAPMTILLASPAGAGITGQVISVDGGWQL